MCIDTQNPSLREMHNDAHAASRSFAALSTDCRAAQTAARHANAIRVLVNVISDNSSSTEMLECAIAALRNLCVNSEENQEELNRCVCMLRTCLSTCINSGFASWYYLCCTPRLSCRVDSTERNYGCVDLTVLVDLTGAAPV